MIFERFRFIIIIIMINFIEQILIAIFCIVFSCVLEKMLNFFF